jgi:hypothetical protein
MLAAHGVKVAVSGPDAAAIEQVVGAIRSTGQDAIRLVADCTDFSVLASARAQVTLAWQDFAFMTGGPGYASLLGIFIAVVSLPCLSQGLLPRWVCLWGLALGVVVQLSILSLLVSGVVYFVPRTRFPGFGWLMVCGFVLSWTTPTPAVSAADPSK